MAVQNYRTILRDKKLPAAYKALIFQSQVVSQSSYLGEWLGMDTANMNSIQTEINKGLRTIFGTSSKTSQWACLPLTLELNVPLVHQSMCQLRARLYYKSPDLNDPIQEMATGGFMLNLGPKEPVLRRSEPH